MSPLLTTLGALGPFVLVFGLSLIVEGLIEYYGTRLPSAWKPHAAALLGIALCLLWNADFLALLGYPALVPYAGNVLTGFLIGRGSNWLATLYKQFQLIKLPAATTNEVIASAPPVEAQRHAAVIDADRRTRRKDGQA